VQHAFNPNNAYKGTSKDFSAGRGRAAYSCIGTLGFGANGSPAAPMHILRHEPSGSALAGQAAAAAALSNIAFHSSTVGGCVAFAELRVISRADG